MAKQPIATFSFLVDSNASKVASEAAKSIDGLRDSINGGKAKMKELSAELSNLRGNSDQVKNAKEALKAAFERERASITQAELGLKKLGTSTAGLMQKDRELARVKADREKLESTQEKARQKREKAEKEAASAAKDIKRQLDLNKDSMVSFATAGVVGMAALALSVVAVGAKFVSLSVDAGKFLLVSANMSRAAQINREALLGNAKDATALGNQIERIAGVVPRSRDELNSMASSLVKAGLSGKALVDSLEAVAGAANEELSSKLKGILEAGKLTQRIQPITRNDLIGTGLSFDDVASSLATSMKVGMAQAKQALIEGRVSVSVGAEALKNAVNKRFGEINARKMLDLNVMATRFADKLSGLGASVKLEPLLKAFDSLLGLFDESTVSGAALKDLATTFGNEIVGGLVKAAPLAKAFFKGAILGALHLGIGYFQLKKSLQDAFGKDSVNNILTVENALKAGSVAVKTMAAAFAVVATNVGTLGAFAYASIKPVMMIGDAVVSAVKIIKAIDLKASGKALIDGLVQGIRDGLASVRDTMSDLSGAIKNTLKRALGIASPSKVFREYGRNTADGFSLGVEDGTNDAHAAISGISSAPSAASPGALAPRMQSAASKASGGITNRFDISITISGGGGKVDTQDLRTQVTRIFEECAEAAGFGMGAPA